MVNVSRSRKTKSYVPAAGPAAGPVPFLNTLLMQNDEWRPKIAPQIEGYVTGRKPHKTVFGKICCWAPAAGANYLAK